MRTEVEVEQFLAHVLQKYPEEQAMYYARCYDACIPKLFWDVRGDQVVHNKGVFRDIVLRYCQKWRRALKHGYGLMLIGDNGTGKTMFLSFVLTQMIKREASVYYTTLPQLDVDIKRGFRDKEIEARLVEMFDSDFVVIDEVGKEYKAKEAYIKTRFELAVKARYDNGDPTLFGSNYSLSSLVEEYGSSVASMWKGRTKVATLAFGDQRKLTTKKMEEDMGFEVDE